MCRESACAYLDDQILDAQVRFLSNIRDSRSRTHVAVHFASSQLVDETEGRPGGAYVNDCRAQLIRERH